MAFLQRVAGEGYKGGRVWYPWLEEGDPINTVLSNYGAATSQNIFSSTMP